MANKVSKGEELGKLTVEEEQLLKSPGLLQRYDKEFDKKIVKETQNRRAIFLTGCGIFVKNHATASFNECLNSTSGSGKDYTAKNVLSIFPSSIFYHRSRISPTALTYWHNARFDPDWCWDGKILLLSDISNSVLNCDVFKVFMSDETTSTITINNKAVDIEIKGKPIIFLTTANANLGNEILRRLPLLELDESVNQTREIKRKQAQFAAKGLTDSYNPIFTSALSKLERVSVIIPFANKIVDCLPDKHIIMRTHFQRFLDFIKASAALHQFQREKDELGNVIATGVDYDYGRIPLLATTSNSIMVPLTKKQKRLLEICKKMQRFSVPQIAPYVPFISERRLYDALDKLQELGFLTSDLEERENSRKPVRMYSYVQDMSDIQIPTWDEICKKTSVASDTSKESLVSNMSDDSNVPVISDRCDMQNDLPEPIEEEAVLNDEERFIEAVKSEDKGEGADLQEVQIKLQMNDEDFEKLWIKLKTDGQNVFENRPGMVKLL